METENTLPKVLTVNEHPYTVLRLLGKGKGGYSYLVRDGDKEYVLKQIHHAVSYTHLTLPTKA